MSHQSSTPTKKSVFDRIGGGNSAVPTTIINASNKSTHGFCNSFIKSGSCPLGDACKYIHEQPNLDKQQPPSKDELRITKTTTRVVDITPLSSIKSTVIVNSAIQSTRTVVESITPSIEHSDRRSSNTDRKQSQNRSELKSKPTSSAIESAASSTSKKNDHSNKESKKKKPSSHESRHATSKKHRSAESDSAVSSASDSEYIHSSHKRKKHEQSHSSSKTKRRDSISPVRHRPNSDEEETLNDQLMRQTQLTLAAMNKSPKRTIVIAHNINTERKKDTGGVKRSIKDETSLTKKFKQSSSPSRSTNKIDDEEMDESKSKSKALPEIEILSSSSSKKTNERRTTIHPRSDPITVTGKKVPPVEMKRERKSPAKSTKNTSSEQQQKTVDKRRRHSSSTNSSASSSEKKSGKTSQTKPAQSDNSKQQPGKTRNPPERYERSDRNAAQSSPPVIQLSPPTITSTPPDVKVSVPIETEKIVPVAPPHSPICVILDEDSSPTPPVEKKVVRQTSTTTKKRSENKDSPKQTKRSQESDKTRSKETTTSSETKRKRLNDGNSRKTESSSKDNRSTSNRSDTRRNANDSSRDDSSNRKRKQDKSESLSASTTLSKPRNSKNNDRRDTAPSSTDNKRSVRRHGSGKEKENVTDAEEHTDANLNEPVLPKQTALEAYMAMDWSLLSRDKRIPLNSQSTSRVARFNGNTHRSNLIERLGVAKRLLTDEQKKQLTESEVTSSPLTHFMAQLQLKTAPQIVHSCERRFGSCAKDMIDMRHKWFTRSIEPMQQQYEFINKEHYLAFQQAINMLLNKTPNESPIVQIETTTADALLSSTSTVPSILPV